jgi:hypothetical protein
VKRSRVLQVDDFSSGWEESGEVDAGKDIPYGYLRIKWNQSASRGDWVNPLKTEFILNII